MRYGVTMFATDLSIDVVELARAVEERGSTRCGCPSTPHPHQPPHPAPQRRRAAREVQALARPAGRAGRGGECHHDAAPGHRHPSAGPARPHRHRQGGRLARPRVRWPAALGVGFGWNEDEMADHGVAYRRRRAIARARAGDAGAVARRGRRVHRRARVVPARVVVAQTRPARPRGAPVGARAHGRGRGPELFAHAVEYADGWMPIGGAGLTAASPPCGTPTRRAATPTTSRWCPTRRCPTTASSTTTATSG